MRCAKESKAPAETRWDRPESPESSLRIIRGSNPGTALLQGEPRRCSGTATARGCKAGWPVPTRLIRSFKGGERIQRAASTDELMTRRDRSSRFTNGCTGATHASPLPAGPPGPEHCMPLGEPDPLCKDESPDSGRSRPDVGGDRRIRRRIKTIRSPVVIEEGRERICPACRAPSSAQDLMPHEPAPPRAARRTSIEPSCGESDAPPVRRCLGRPRAGIRIRSGRRG